MDKSEQLTKILERLNRGEASEKLKAEAQEFLKAIDPSELSIAEQVLIKAGMEPEDLKHLCSIHMEMLNGEVNKIKGTIETGHVIDTLIKEHDMISNFLDELETINQEIQNLSIYDKNNSIYERLLHVANHLVGAEPHHQREEQVLFPEIEKSGVTGPTKVMTMEHEELRRYKHEVKSLAENVANMDFEDFKNKLNVSSKLLVLTLRDHIFKENNILYPTALEVIKDEKTWQNLKEDCDKIGYCCFTPEK